MVCVCECVCERESVCVCVGCVWSGRWYVALLRSLQDWPVRLVPVSRALAGRVSFISQKLCVVPVTTKRANGVYNWL